MPTNEELAAAIQDGQRELIPVLWDQIQKLLHAKSTSFYYLRTDICARCGVELNDLKQECYPAFLQAIAAFDRERGLTFTAYLNYPFQNAVNALLGLRSERGKHDPLNHAMSLDAPVDAEDSDSCALLELIGDDTSADFVKRIDNDDEAAFVRRIVDALPEPDKCVIRALYFEGLTLQATAETLAVSLSAVRYAEQRALKQLRKNPELRRMYREQMRHEEWVRFSRVEHSPEYFDQCRRMREKVNKG